MKFYVQSLVILVMGTNAILAGTYGTEIRKQNTDSDEDEENYPKQEENLVPNYIKKKENQVQGIYTRTIVWPVSYSFISANVETSPKEEDLSRNEASNDRSDHENYAEEWNNPEKINNHGKSNVKLLYIKRPVLQGNEEELKQKDFPRRQNHEPESGIERPYMGKESYKPVTEPILDDIPLGTENYHNIQNLTEDEPVPVHKYNRDEREGHKISYGPQTTPIPIRKQKQKASTQKSIQPLETIPEVLLRPPPQRHKHRPVIPGSTIQAGEYINQNRQNNYNLNYDDVDENNSQNKFNRKPEPSQNNNDRQYQSRVSSTRYAPRIGQEPDLEEEELEAKKENSEKSEDLKNAESEETKHKKVKPKNSKSSAGSDYIEHHEGKKTEKGEKGYKKDNKHEKAEKGHHKKEEHQGTYKEEKGQEKKHHKGEKVYGEHHKGEKGKKEKKYGGGKKHKKGHSTHGEHNIVKKDEYIKNTKFYDEDHGGGEEEEHGEFQGESGEHKGGKKEVGHSEKGYHKQGTSKKGHHDKGHHDEEHSGYDHEDGTHKYSGYEKEYADKKGKKASKKWEKKDK